MEWYLMYLRKSRMDTDFDEVSVEETLNRHRRILESFCKERRLNVVDVLEEVVSGESLSSRPKMLRLLELVNTGMYAGVICIDIERLSRGHPWNPVISCRCFKRIIVKLSHRPRSMIFRMNRINSLLI